jgi:hypothetical protein
MTLLLVCFSLTAVFIFTAAAASLESVPSPIEFLGCFNEKEKVVETVRVTDSIVYQCKFGWRYGVGENGTTVTNSTQSHILGGIALELSGYNASSLHVSYDKLRLKKIATDPAKGGHTVKLLQVFTTTAREAQGTWFQVSFNYTGCAGDIGAPLKLVVAPLGSAPWAPLVQQLNQDRDICRGSKLREAASWFGLVGDGFSRDNAAAASGMRFAHTLLLLQTVSFVALQVY